MTGCAAPRHDGQQEPSPAEPHAHLCRPCRLGLASDLRRLPGLHAELSFAAQAAGGDGNGLPFSEPAAECRDQIRHDLTWWAMRITGLRGLDAPPVLLPGWSDQPVLVLAGWLAGQVTWCSFRDWAPDMAGAISADRSRAAALLDPWIFKHFPIPGADVACLNCEASEGAMCSWCGDVYAPGALVSHRQPDGDGEMTCTTAGLAQDRHGTWCGELWVTVYVYAADHRKSFIGCTACPARWEFGGAWLPFVRQVLRRRSLQEAG